MIGDSPLAREFWERGKSESCPIYDMHGHMGPLASIYFPRPEARDMLRTMDECGVRMLVFSHHMALHSPDVGNRLAVEAVRRYPGRLRAYCSVNPNYPERLEADLATIEELIPEVYVGFKFLPDYHGIALTDERYRPAWEYANERELLVLTHTWGGSKLDGPEVVRQVAERYPRVKLLLGHSCHGEWDAAGYYVASGGAMAAATRARTTTASSWTSSASRRSWKRSVSPRRDPSPARSSSA